jgi:hypothetical protein
MVTGRVDMGGRETRKEEKRQGGRERERERDNFHESISVKE